MKNPSTEKEFCPRTLQEAIKHFSDPDVCVQFMVAVRWPFGVVCAHCGCECNGKMSPRRVWNCKHCKKQFSVKVGSVFEDSPLGLDKWLPALWLISNAKNGISSYEIHRALGVTQKTAWFMLHRIRHIMTTGSFEKASGEVEVDETFIGGKAANMHKAKRAEKIKGRGAVGKEIVMGILERGGEVKANIVPNTTKKTLQGAIEENVETGSEVFTDAFHSYKGLSPEYIHESVDHACQYVRDTVVHTNGLENFWSLLKRSIKGTYVSVDAYHLMKYLDEQSFRYNARHGEDADRFLEVLESVVGHRLTYKQLIGAMEPDSTTIHDAASA